MKTGIYDKICGFLTKCFYFMCCLFPFLMALGFSVVCFFELLWRKTFIYNLPPPEIMKSVRMQNQLFAVIIVCLLALCFALIYKAFTKLQLNLTLKKLIIILAAIFAITFFVSSIYIFVFGNKAVPFTEYSYSWLAAHGDEAHLERYSNYYSWSVFVAYIKLVIGFLGDKYIIVLLLNAVYRGIVAILIFLTVNKIFNKINISALAALVYGLMPSSAMHAFTGGPEILSTVFAVLLILLFLYLFEAKSVRKIILISTLLGTNLALLYSTKQLHLPIAATALFITYFIFAFKGCTKEKISIAVKKASLILTCVSLSTFVILQLITLQVQSYLQIEYKDILVSHTLRIGLDINGHGQIIVSRYPVAYNKLIESGSSPEEASDILSAQLKEEWKNANLSDIAYWQITKNIWAWQDELRPYYFFDTALMNTNAKESNPTMYKAATDYLPAIAQFYYIALLALCALFCIAFKDKINNHGIFLITLYTFGFAFCLTLTESQSHYKSIIIPFICIIAAIGAEHTFIELKGVFKNENKQ